jgi:hypothetical protein
VLLVIIIIVVVVLGRRRRRTPKSTAPYSSHRSSNSVLPFVTATHTNPAFTQPFSPALGGIPMSPGDECSYWNPTFDASDSDAESLSVFGDSDTPATPNLSRTSSQSQSMASNSPKPPRIPHSPARSRPPQSPLRSSSGPLVPLVSLSARSGSTGGNDSPTPGRSAQNDAFKGAGGLGPIPHDASFQTLSTVAPASPATLPAAAPASTASAAPANVAGAGEEKKRRSGKDPRVLSFTVGHAPARKSALAGENGAGAPGYVRALGLAAVGESSGDVDTEEHGGEERRDGGEGAFEVPRFVEPKETVQVPSKGGPSVGGKILLGLGGFEAGLDACDTAVNDAEEDGDYQQP